MAQTADIGPLFFQVLKLNRNAPVLHSGKSQEVDEPFRTSVVKIVRIPLTGIGIAVGWWQQTGFNEEQALIAAVDGFGLDLYDTDLDDPEVRDQIRENIARRTDDLDQEWMIMDALGVTD